MAITISKQACALREVVLRRKPPEMLAVSPKGTVPVIVLPNGQLIEESLEIMRWALDANDPDGWLTPLSDQAEDVEALIAENDGPFKKALDRYKYSTRYQPSDPLHHRARGLVFLKKLNTRLLETPFLCSTKFTFADAAIVPFIRQFANHDREWFNALDLFAIRKWLESILESKLFASVMKKYPVWTSGMDEPIFPFS